MKKTLSIMFSTLVAVSLNAQEVVASGEYAYIQPVAIEAVPIKIEIVPEPILEPEMLALDDDNDGVLNQNDRCPNTIDGAKVDVIGCIILPDDDKDGVPNKDDKCLNTKKGTPVDYRGCEIDSDFDGVVDSKDQCPNTAEEFSVDGYGCPQTATLKVNFASAKYDINQELINDLQNFALFLKENTGYDLIIYGFTDSIGKTAVNQKLSQYRANAIKEVLSLYGINPSKMTTVGKGEANPVADNKTKEGRAQNRRIEVELIDLNK